MRTATHGGALELRGPRPRARALARSGGAAAREAVRWPRGAAQLILAARPLAAAGAREEAEHARSAIARHPAERRGERIVRARSSQPRREHSAVRETQLPEPRPERAFSLRVLRGDATLDRRGEQLEDLCLVGDRGEAGRGRHRARELVLELG
jgi:hypothetical protein